jgi:hypothetical protein
MSNYLAVATVTATLQRELQAVIGTDVSAAKATTVRPDATGHGLPEVGVNIFLYEVAPNASLRNADLPARNGNGQVVQRPAAALDLHYLMSFYGKDSELEPQRVLGSVVRHLHSRPLLTRKMIRDTITNPPASSYLGNSNLADAVESVRFSPLSLSLEELSKLWSILLQTPYALSTAYRASLVFIEEELTPVTPLPVRERKLFVVPFQQPFIENVDPKIIDSGATLTIAGQNLRGVTKLKFGASLVAPATVTAEKITVALPATLQPGVRTVQVIHDFDFKSGLGNEPHRGFESNVAPFILQPQIVTVPIPDTAHGATLTLTLSPPIGREQSVALLLNSDINNYVIPLPTRPPSDPLTATSFNFKILTTVLPDTYLLRVRVDGAESALEVDTDDQSPTYNQYIGPNLKIT